MIKFFNSIVGIFMALLVFLGLVSNAYAQQLGDYTNLTTTRTLTFANSLTGSMYDQVTAVLPFLIQIGIVLIVIALVLAIPWYIWTKIKAFGHTGR